MKTEWKTGRRREREPRAFSLLEVMIAIGIFFMAAFAILGLVSSSLEYARRLQRPMVDAAAVASWYSETNKIVEGTISGDMSEFLGKAYQGYTYSASSVEVQSNMLYQVDFFVYGPDAGKPVLSKISALFYNRHSPGSLDGAMTAR
jgi:Tfp pilus assembly protein PilV